VPGIEAAISPDIDLDLWGKFVMLASFAAVACVGRVPIGQVLSTIQHCAHASSPPWPKPLPLRGRKASRFPETLSR